MVDQEVLDTEIGQFDCDDCEIAKAIQDLRPENAEAWALFQRVVTRMVVELGCGNEIVRQCVRGLERDDALELLERFSMMYDIVYPARTES